MPDQMRFKVICNSQRIISKAFGKRKIRDIKVSDAKLWFKKMHKDERLTNSYGALYRKMIKVLMVCHGNICGKAQKSEDFQRVLGIA